MGIVNKARKLLSANRQTMLLLLEAYLYLGLARFLLVFRPFAKVAPSLGVPMKETPVAETPQHNKTLIHVHDAVHTMSRHTFWESMCLVRAIAALKMLERRRIASTLYLGTAKDEAGNMIAHAWLRSGPFYITGAEGMERYAVVGTFANDGCD